MDDLLGHMDAPHHGQAHGKLQSGSSLDHPVAPIRTRNIGDWIPGEGGPLALPAHSLYSGNPQSLARDEARSEEPRPVAESQRTRSAAGPEPLSVREGELMSKLYDLLHSPLGPGICRIIEELHQILPRARGLS
jgi:hypothetical protein